jgi:periplasmic divalent cation tolerance protein
MEDCKDLDILAITTTVASRGEADALARALLERRLAACVQVEEGLIAFYRWQGKACEDAEVRLTVKTLPACAGALQEFFREHHPYELPQFLATCMRASAEYHAWVRGEVAIPPVAEGVPDPV